ncbi:hypothetical protein NHX12_018948, partial [Muraenolepis orangiensis]
VIMNLTKALDRQKEKMEVMRTFAAWRLRLHQARAANIARAYSDYEARIAQPSVLAQAEIQELRVYAPPPPDERGFSSLAQQQERPVSSARFSPVHFDPPAHPSHTEAGPM